MEILYDKPYEITYKQYVALKIHAKGIVAAKKEGDKFFFKLWLEAGRSRVKQLLLINAK